MNLRSHKLLHFLMSHWVILLLMLIVTVFHFYKLGEIPLTLNPDEASIGYNALLLQRTGLDEWGKKWPIILDAFGDQKLIGYPALVVIAFHFFGYQDWVVKLPALLAGTSLVLLMYVLQIQLGRNKKQALVAAFLIGIVPVFFFYSRVAFEAMIALVCLLSALSLLFLSRSREKIVTQLILDFIAALALLAALFTYNSPVILVPLITLAMIFDRGIIHWKKWLPVVTFTGAMWLAFAVYFWPLTIQKSKITLFGDETTLAEFGRYRDQFSGGAKSILGNKYFFYSEKMLTNYLNTWSPGFLMKNVGGHPWHTMPGFGYLFWSVYVFGIVGMIGTVGTIGQAIREAIRKNKLPLVTQLLTGNSPSSRQLSVFCLFLFSPLPAIITVNAPQATRSLLFLFIWCLYAAVGIELFAAIGRKLLPKKIPLIQKSAAGWVLNNLILGCCLSLVVAESLIYFSFYFGRYARSQQLQSMFQPGLAVILNQINQSTTQPLAIVDERGFNYILVAWYLKLDPYIFFSTIKKQQPDKINFKYGEQVSVYHFIAKPADRRPTEKEVVYWDMSTDQWQILNY